MPPRNRSSFHDIRLDSCVATSNSFDAALPANYNRFPQICQPRERIVKKKAAGYGLVGILIGLGAIFGWYAIHTQSTQAELNRAIADYESKKQPVTVTFTVSVPPGTPQNQVLYVSGNVPALGSWDGAGIPLQRTPDGKYTGTAGDLLNGMDYSFKITRGTWGTVETSAEGKNIDNHNVTAKKDGKVEVVVAGWNDGGKATPGRVTMVPGIQLHKKFHSSALNNDRTLIVYLPPDYEKNKDARYPVLYLQDGGNLMDEATSFQGIEWNVDEAAQRCIASGWMRPAIIVGVYNTEQRSTEFTPPLAGVANPKPNGDAYAKMIVEEVKPFIDEHYRTQPDRKNTLIGGGSLGALISLYTAKTHPGTFGTVVALSPWLRLDDKQIIKDLVGNGAWLKESELYVDMGTDPGHNYPGGAEAALADGQALVAELEKVGLIQGQQFTYREIEGGKHNEASWAATIDQVLGAVLPGPNNVAPSTQPAGGH
jgi:predicted alpha/beta superfamily hydrolase